MPALHVQIDGLGDHVRHRSIILRGRDPQFLLEILGESPQIEDSPFHVG